MYRKENKSGAKRFKMDNPRVLGEHLRTEINNPDEQIAIEKGLLQDIRTLLDNGADEYAECKTLRDKLDSLYPFLNQPK